MKLSCFQVAALMFAASSVIYFLALFTSLSSIRDTSAAEIGHVHKHIKNIRTPLKVLQANINTNVKATPTIPPGLQAGEDISSDGIDDTVTAVVQCRTSAGNITIDVRQGWSPLGAQRYLDLVDHGLYDDLPFFRVCPKYVTQFGAKHWPHGNPLREAKLTTSIHDDPPMWGKRDMTFGYIFFAGSGANSRGAQMVLALCPDIDACRQTGLGKALWETPVGSVRKEDFPVLEKIMSSGKPYPRLEMLGQHPDAGGPNQGKLVSDPEYLQHEYPFMEYWRGCRVQHRGVRYARPRSVDLGSRPAVALASSSQENTDRRVATQLKPLEGADADNNRPFRVEFIVSTSTEEAVENDRIVFEITPTWAPLGAKRFKELVSAGYFDGARFFRAIKHFMAQFGIAKDPATTKLWQSKRFLDDARIESNKRGTISFATSGPNSRSTQLFINFVDNSFLDSEGFSPIGRIVEGLSVLDKINTEYGEGGRGDGSDGKGPSQGRANNEGNAYLQKFFPRLSYIVTSRVIT